MELNDNKKINWALCCNCKGQGKITRGPSKKRRRRYQRELKAFKINNDKELYPQALSSNKDICLICTGSGLMASDSLTQIDSNYPHIAIIGGGIGGTALAVACLHRGIPFTLYERDQDFDTRSQGYGLTLQQSSKAIAGLGIVSLDGAITSMRHIVHNTEGKIIGEWGIKKWLQTLPEKNSKRKNIHIARQTLRSALLGQLQNTESIKWGHTLKKISLNKEGTLGLDFQKNEKKEMATADLIVGADGIRSLVRSHLIGENNTPLHYLGCIVILGICSLKSINNSNSLLLDSATVFQTVNGHERVYMMPYDDDSIMWQISFPLSEKKAKELHKKGPRFMKKEVITRLGQWHDPIPQILALTPESKITGYPVYDRKLLEPKLLEHSGNATLIGDAAHPMSPFKGQGANQAILDALNLARMISKECQPDIDWRKIGLRKIVLNKFEKEMLDRTASKVLDSAIAVEQLHSDAVLHKGDQPRGRGIQG